MVNENAVTIPLQRSTLRMNYNLRTIELSQERPARIVFDLRMVDERLFLLDYDPAEKKFLVGRHDDEELVDVTPSSQMISEYSNSMDGTLGMTSLDSYAWLPTKDVLVAASISGPPEFDSMELTVTRLKAQRDVRSFSLALTVAHHRPPRGGTIFSARERFPPAQGT